VTDHFFASDLHLGHVSVLNYDQRPFGSITEHDTHLRDSFSEAGSACSVLWLLGDVARRKNDLLAFMEAVKPRWGAINLIRGNHDDKVAWRYREMFDNAHEALYLKIDDNTKVYMSHYAHRVWRNSHRGSLHIHGHSHGALPRLGRSMDVGVNCIDYKPISIESIRAQVGNMVCTYHH
jgi:calcineurin-like phosphoesterase family protein